MHPALRKLLLVVIVCCATQSVASMTPSTARAYHTYKERLLDTTAYSLPRRGFRLGLMKLSYGIIDRLEMSTYTAPWLLGLILEELSPNIEFKSTLINQRRFALSVSAGFVWGRVKACTSGLCTRDSDFSRVNYLIFPINVTSSLRFNSRISFHLGGQYTATDLAGGTQPAETEIRGAAVVDLLQLYAMLEWRVSRVVALTLTTRWLPYVSDAVARGQLIIDEDTGAIIGIQVDVFDLTNGFAVIPGAVFSWKRANLRMGVGYGTFFLEGVGLAIPPSLGLKGVSPEFDVFVRF
jgi:hypothetical protein